MWTTWVWFPVEVTSSDLQTSSRFWANPALYLFEVDKLVPGNTEANTGSWTMIVAPINRHWWYNYRLKTYVPRPVGRTQIGKSRPSLTAQGVLISFFNEALKWVSNFVKFLSPNFQQIWWRPNLFTFIKASFQNKNTPSGCLKKFNSCFAVNALIELLGFTQYMKRKQPFQSFLQAVLKNLTHGRVPI